MNTPVVTPAFQVPERKGRIHPLMAAAAVSVIALAGTGIASMTGLIGSRAAQPASAPFAGTSVAPAPVAAAPVAAVTAPAAAPVAPAAPVAAVRAPVQRAPAPHPQVGARPAVAAPVAQPVQVATAPQPAPAPVAEAPRAAAPVADTRTWATVEAVRTVRTGGNAQGMGAVAGGVLGGVLGHQVGGGTGKQVATVVGAIGGGVLGHQAERQLRGETKYEATVRLDDGSQRTFSRPTPWNLQSGERVWIMDDTLVVGSAPAPRAPMREAVYTPGG